jgi:ketosteroid isomerase-like protein
MSMNPQDNVKIAQQAYENFKAGNIPALLNLVADDVEWILPEVAGVAISGTREGRDEVADFFKTLNETQEVIRFEPREFIAQNDQVVVLGSYSFRVKATRQRFESDWAHVFTIQNGHIVHFQEFTDTAAVAVAYRKAAAA